MEIVTLLVRDVVGASVLAAGNGVKGGIERLTESDKIWMFAVCVENMHGQHPFVVLKG